MSVTVAGSGESGVEAAARGEAGKDCHTAPSGGVPHRAHDFASRGLGSGHFTGPDKV